MTATQTAPHAHQFPCQPPDGDLLAPGDCLVCGKPYAVDVAEKRAREAGLAVLDPRDVAAVLTAKGPLPNALYDRLCAAAGMPS
jgi:hypothetical protein